jgi:hypothetical protein
VSSYYEGDRNSVGREEYKDKEGKREEVMRKKLRERKECEKRER